MTGRRATGPSPAELIDVHVAARSELLDSELLAEIDASPVLAAAGDLVAWRDQAYLDGVAYRLVALARIVAQRDLYDGVFALRDRAGLAPTVEIDALADACLAEIERRAARR